MPDLSLERSISGPVCGLDEVGRGPLAGPVVAACVVIPEECYALPFIAGIKDSKKLSAAKLENLFTLITDHFPHAVAEISVTEIDKINILQASMKAMSKACRALPAAPVHALVDGNRCPDLPCPAQAVIKGDNISTSIAAASILAKVTRDRLMAELAREHPYYGWERNVGYPSKEHLEAINRHGITPHHRKSFAPIRNFIEFGQTRTQTRLAV